MLALLGVVLAVGTKDPQEAHEEMVQSAGLCALLGGEKDRLGCHQGHLFGGKPAGLLPF